MRTSIVLHDKLISEAFNRSKARTKKELVHVALREAVDNHSRLDLRALKGKIAFRDDYDCKACRRIPAG